MKTIQIDAINRRTKEKVKVYALEVTEDEFRNLSNEYCGFCFHCGSVKYGDCEPDARDYECEDCGENRVYGIEESLMYNRISLTDKYDDDNDDLM